MDRSYWKGFVSLLEVVLYAIINAFIVTKIELQISPYFPLSTATPTVLLGVDIVATKFHWRA